MPTYTIDMGQGGASDSWGDAASALAKAFTPDYEAMGQAKVDASRAYGNYASAENSLANARKAGAAAALDENKLATLNQFRSAVGDLPLDEQLELLIESAPAMGLSGADVEAYVSTFGNIAGAQGGATLEQMESLRGTEYADTRAGVTQQQDLDRELAFIENPLGEGEVRFLESGEIAGTGPMVVGEGERMLLPQQTLQGTPEENTVSNIFEGRTKTTSTKTSDWQNFQIENEDGTTSSVLARDRGDGVLVDQNGNPIPATALKMGTTADQPDRRSATEIAIADQLGEQIASMWAAGSDADARLAQTEFMRQMLEATGGTGRLTEMTSGIRAGLAQMGITDPSVSAAEQVFRTLTGEDVMATLAQTKGAISNFEMRYFESINPGLAQNTMTNEILLYVRGRKAQRDKMIQQIIDEGIEAQVGDRVISRQINELIAAMPLMPADQAAAFGLPPPPTTAGGLAATGADPLVERWIGGGQ